LFEASHDRETGGLTMRLRSWLFVPGDSERKLEKIAVCGADAVIIDLEDSVAADRKAFARGLVTDWLATHSTIAPRIFIRVNALTTGMSADDCQVAATPGVTGIMLPKAEGGKSAAEADMLLRVAEAEAGLDDGALAIAAIATETAYGVLTAGTYSASSARLIALAWGAEDLSADIGATSARNSDGSFTPLFQHARTMTLLGAAAANVAAIDGIVADFRDEDGLKREAADAFRDGFSGKMAIHPAQVAAINAAFTPPAAELERSQAIIAAFEAAPGAGVVALDGRMLDMPHLRLARRLLALGGL
jgi:citrate lyase subunit beta / citryl-CoA lyase